MVYYLVESLHHNPYVNLGYEEYMFSNLKEDEALFYLWQNQHTVVIGKNQNAFKECKVKQLQSDDGFLARRTSGGGAVYHDLGNLNFTFILPNSIFDIHRQLDVIIHALKACGIHASFAGRNDIEVEGYKVSGNAFAKNKTHQLHHGTLLFDVNMSDLSKYLNVSSIKMASKGVESVRKRVANLVDFNKDCTLNGLKQALIRSFNDQYKSALTQKEMNISSAKPFISKHESEAWQTNKIFDFQAQLHHKFTWGEVQAFFVVEYGIIKEVALFSDALAMDLIDYLESIFVSCDYDDKAMRQRNTNTQYKEQTSQFIEALFKEGDV